MTFEEWYTTKYEGHDSGLLMTYSAAKQAWEAALAPRAKYDPATQPGSPEFDGAEAYQAHLASLYPDEAAPRADAEKDAALDALKRAERFIVNGTEFGYIRMPDAPDPALDTLPAIRRAIAILAANGEKK